MWWILFHRRTRCYQGLFTRAIASLRIATRMCILETIARSHAVGLTTRNHGRKRIPRCRRWLNAQARSSQLIRAACATRSELFARQLVVITAKKQCSVPLQLERRYAYARTAIQAAARNSKRRLDLTISFSFREEGERGRSGEQK